MTSLPLRYGCSGKLRASRLAELLNMPVPSSGWLSQDAGSLPQAAHSASIDTIFRMYCSPSVFARVAFFHAANDLYAAGSAANSVLASFGFSESDLQSGAAAEVLKAFRQVLSEFTVSCAKYHTYTSDLTSVTLTVLSSGSLKPFPQGCSGQCSLILTKPLGGALASYAAALHADTAAELLAEDVMLAHHGHLLELFREFCLFGTTDVSGFGLLGHLAGMASALVASVRVSAAEVPTFSSVHGVSVSVPHDCGSESNWEDFREMLDCVASLPKALRLYLTAPETSGPIVCVVSEEFTSRFLNEIIGLGFAHARVIGAVVPGDPKVFVR